MEIYKISKHTSIHKEQSPADSKQKATWQQLPVHEKYLHDGNCTVRVQTSDEPTGHPGTGKHEK